VGSTHVPGKCQQEFRCVGRRIIEDPVQESCEHLSYTWACDPERLEIASGDREITPVEWIAALADFRCR
jgi:hypothetical protein